MLNDDLQTTEYSDAGCCCCSTEELPTWEEPTWEEPTWEEPAWEEPAWEAPSDTWSDEPTTWSDPAVWTEAPAAAPLAPLATDASATWGGPAPVALPDLAVVGGDPGATTFEYPSVAYVGGTDVGDTSPIDPASFGYVGGPTPMSLAARDVAQASDAFAQLSLPAMRAELWGGTPADWTGGPTVPLHGHTPIHTVVHSRLALDGLANLARNNVVVPFF